MYLVDTNIFLHVLLEKENYNSAFRFLKNDYEFFVTDFSIYSICILLSKLKKYELMQDFMADISKSDCISVVSIDLNDIDKIINIEKEFDLDFDDAYQYHISEVYDLIIVSYDKDFQKTERGCKKPEEVL